MRKTEQLSEGLALVVEPGRQEASLWRRFSELGDASLREQLFARYRRLALAVARRHARKQNASQDRARDIEQFAYRGLLEAIDRYDPSRSVPFPAFARARISGSIFDGLSQLDEQGARLRFQKRVERERIASLKPASSDKRSAIFDLAELVTELALGLMLEAEERRERGYLIGQPDSAFEALAWVEARATLQLRVAELPGAERTVIQQHYQNDMLFSQIAVMMGISKGRVSQLHKSALGRLRRSMGSFA